MKNKLIHEFIRSMVFSSLIGFLLYQLYTQYVSGAVGIVMIIFFLIIILFGLVVVLIFRTPGLKWKLTMVVLLLVCICIAFFFIKKDFDEKRDINEPRRYYSYIRLK